LGEPAAQDVAAVAEALDRVGADVHAGPLRGRSQALHHRLPVTLAAAHVQHAAHRPLEHELRGIEREPHASLDLGAREYAGARFAIPAIEIRAIVSQSVARRAPGPAPPPGE